MTKTNKRSFRVFKEVISCENVLGIAELIVCKETKNLIRFSGSFAAKIHTQICKDIYRKNEPGYILSDNYDIVQTVALFLCEHFGKHLEDTYTADKKGKDISIQYYCYKLITRMICGRYRDFMKSASMVEALNNKETITYTPSEEEYIVAEQMMDKMKLTPYHREILNYRMAGMTLRKIAKLVNRSAGTVQSVIYTIQGRYKKYLCEQ